MHAGSFRIIEETSIMNLYPLIVGPGLLNHNIDFVSAIETSVSISKLNGYYKEPVKDEIKAFWRERILTLGEISEVVDAVRKRNFSTARHYDSLLKIYDTLNNKGIDGCKKLLGEVEFKRFFSSFEIELADVVIRSLVFMGRTVSKDYIKSFNDRVYSDFTFGVQDPEFTEDTKVSDAVEDVDTFTSFITFLMGSAQPSVYHDRIITNSMSSLITVIYNNYELYHSMNAFVRIKTAYNRMRGLTGKLF